MENVVAKKSKRNTLFQFDLWLFTEVPSPAQRYQCCERAGSTRKVREVQAQEELHHLPQGFQSAQKPWVLCGGATGSPEQDQRDLSAAAATSLQCHGVL